MRILIAEDDRVLRCELERTLQQWGHEVLAACDGLAAWDVLQRADAPKLAILDWMMPLLDGPEVVHRVRSLDRREPTYCILLTVKDAKADVVAGLEGGADDYVTKPFNRRELRARVRVGERVVTLQHGLADRVRQLEAALAQVKQLKGLLPICSYCKKVRDGGDYWQQVEAYISAHSDLEFSHGICPACWHQVVEPEMNRAGMEMSPRPPSP